MNTNDKPFFLPFLRKEQLNKDTFSFYFQRNGQERDFTPGQYYEMKLNIPSPDERGDSRTFTCASSPTEREYLMFTTRIIKSSFKMALNELVPGTFVSFDGPWNDLKFDENDPRPKVFLAGGIGITPYHSIVKYVVDKNLKTPMILFVSWKKKEDMIFDDFFRDANNHMENFSYVPTLTEEEVGSEWDGEKGRITAEMISKYVYDVKGSQYFFTGPYPMVKDLKQTVLDMGVARDSIVSEDFEGYTA